MNAADRRKRTAAYCIFVSDSMSILTMSERTVVKSVGKMIKMRKEMN